MIAELVRIDSVNPALDHNHPGEDELARYVARWSTDHSLEVRWLEDVAGRPSLIITARGRASQPSAVGGDGGTEGTGSDHSIGGKNLLLNAHLDTVGVAGMRDPFTPTVREGLMYGRGVMDMKASLAACLLTLAEAATKELRGDVVLTAVADEEHDSIGTREALAELANTGTALHGAIVTEPSALDIHVAHRGFSVFEVQLEGKASHTSQPEAGVNALVNLGRLLAAVEMQAATLESRQPHPLLRFGSLQPVLAAGGHELFTTPAQASLTLERRTLPGESPEAMEGELAAMLADLTRADPGFRASFTTQVAREPFAAPPESEIESVLTRAIAAVRGESPARLGAPYWTDAALVAAAGIPTVLFGPVGGGIHQVEEWVDLASVADVRRVLGSVVEEFCG